MQLFYADVRELTDEAAASLLTPADREGALHAMRGRRRVEHIAGRALLRHALRARVGIGADALRIELEALGKPVCVGGPAISVAHSGDFVVCAVAEQGVVGVDVEAERPRGSLAAIAERFFTRAENDWIEGEQPEARFRMLWVLKEAYLKALGVGLAGGLGSLELRIEPPNIVATTRDGSAVPALALFAARGAHVGVAALGAGSLTLAARRFAIAERADALGPVELVAKTA